MYMTEGTTATPVEQPRSNIILGLIVGLIAGIIGALVWGVVVAGLEVRFPYLALVIGFMVAAGVIVGGRGKGFFYGLIAALITLASLLAGNILSQVFMETKDTGQSISKIIQVLLRKPDVAIEILKESMTFLNFGFTVAAVVVAYIVAFGGTLPRRSPQTVDDGGFRDS